MPIPAGFFRKGLHHGDFVMEFGQWHMPQQATHAPVADEEVCE